MNIIHFISGTLLYQLFNIALAVVVIKVIIEKVHWSAYVIIIGLVMNIIFSISASIYNYMIFNSQPISPNPLNMTISSTLSGMAIVGFALEIVGMCIFLIHVINLHKENKELKIDNICKDTTESY